MIKTSTHALRSLFATAVTAFMILMLTMLPQTANAAFNPDSMRNNDQSQSIPTEYCTAADKVNITLGSKSFGGWKPGDTNWPAGSSGFSYVYQRESTNTIESVYREGKGEIFSATSAAIKDSNWTFNLDAPKGVKAGDKVALTVTEPWTFRTVPAEGLLTKDGVKIADIELARKDINEKNPDGSFANKMFQTYIIFTFTEAAERYTDLHGSLTTPIGYGFIRGIPADTYAGSVLDCKGNKLDTLSLQTQAGKHSPTLNGAWKGEVFSDKSHRLEHMEYHFRTDALDCDGTATVDVTLPEGIGEPDPEHAVSATWDFVKGYPTYTNTTAGTWKKTGDHKYQVKIPIKKNQGVYVGAIRIPPDPNSPLNNEPQYTVKSNITTTCGLKQAKEVTFRKPDATSGGAGGNLPPRIIAEKKLLSANQYEVSLKNVGEGEGTNIEYLDVTTVEGEPYPGTVKVNSPSQGVIDGNKWIVGSMKPGATATAKVTLTPNAPVKGDILNRFIPVSEDCETDPDACAEVGVGHVKVTKELVTAGTPERDAVYKITVTNPSTEYDALGVIASDKPGKGLLADTAVWSELSRGEIGDGNNWYIGDMAPGESVTAKVTVAVDEAVYKPGADSEEINIVIVNTPINPPVKECTQEERDAGLCDSVTTGAGHVIIDKKLVKAGNPTVFELTATNESTDYDATGVYVRDIPHLNFEFDSLKISDMTQGEVENDIWRIGTLKPGQNVKAKVTVTPKTSDVMKDAEYENVASVTHDRLPEPDCTDEAMFDKKVCAKDGFGDGRLEIVKTRELMGNHNGKPMGYRLVVKNPSEKYTTHDVVVVEAPGEGLDAGTFKYIAVSRGETDGVKWKIGDMKPGETVEAVVEVNIKPGYFGHIYNEARTGGGVKPPAETCDENTRNNKLCDSAEDKISSPVIELIKFDKKSGPEKGSRSTPGEALYVPAGAGKTEIVYRVINKGDAPIGRLSLTDTVTVGDAGLSEFTLPADWDRLVLQPGEHVDVHGYVTGINGDHKNTATVTGVPVAPCDVVNDQPEPLTDAGEEAPTTADADASTGESSSNTSDEVCFDTTSSVTVNDVWHAKLKPAPAKPTLPHTGVAITGIALAGTSLLAAGVTAVAARNRNRKM